jgi:hypothetical protein
MLSWPCRYVVPPLAATASDSKQASARSKVVSSECGQSAVPAGLVFALWQVVFVAQLDAVIGDPITVVAGVLGGPLPMFLLFVSVAKVSRYLVLAALTLGWTSVVTIDRGSLVCDGCATGPCQMYDFVTAEARLLAPIPEVRAREVEGIAELDQHVQ